MLKRTRVKAFGKGVEIKMEKGKIVEIMGPVVDVEFENGKLPMIKDALTVQLDGKTKVMEVAQQLGNNTVRAIMLASSDGLEKDMEVTATGACIKVPVGDATLGRMFNVLGESIDASLSRLTTTGRYTESRQNLKIRSLQQRSLKQA